MDISAVQQRMPMAGSSLAALGLEQASGFTPPPGLDNDHAFLLPQVRNRRHLDVYNLYELQGLQQAGTMNLMPQTLTNKPPLLPPALWPNVGMQPYLATKPIRSPGNRDDISLASTAVGDEVLSSRMGSPYRSQDGSSDEDERTQYRLILEDLLMAPGAGQNVGKVHTELNPLHAPCELTEMATDRAASSLQSDLLMASSLAHAVDKAPEAPKNEDSGIQWFVDIRKLNSKDTQVISPSFQITPQASVKLMIKPKCVGDRKGQANFRNSKGVGSVEVKFMESSSLAPRIRFCICVGGKDTRGPLEHDFGKSRVCILPKDIQDWDFRSLVSPRSSNLQVSLQVLGITTRSQAKEKQPFEKRLDTRKV